MIKLLYLKLNQDNLLTMKTLAEIRQEQEERQKKYEKDKKEKAQREITGVPGRMSLLKMQSDTVHAIRFVHDYDRCAGYMFHDYDGDFPCSEICLEHYGEVCKFHPIDNPKGFCKKPSTQYGDRFARATKFGLVHVYTLIGKSYDFTDRKTNQRVQGIHKPLKELAIPIGKKEEFIRPFRDANKRGTFMEDIFLIRRIPGSGWDIPEVITETELREMVGKDVPLAMPSEYAAFNQLSRRDFGKLLLTPMPNARIDDLLGPEVVEAPKTEKSAKVKSNPFAAGTDDDLPI